MRYSLLAGGKRLRPMLVLAAAEAIAEAEHSPADDALSLAMPAACAVELIHTYSLVHDDLPAMDDDTLRRGRPTAHVVFGEGMAILAGDGLLTEAFALLAREPLSSPVLSDAQLASRKLQALAAIAEAAGASGMVGGQAIDLEAARPGTAPLDAAGLRGMHARKTGALIVGSTMAGAIMAGASPAQLRGGARVCAKPRPGVSDRGRHPRRRGRVRRPGQDRGQGCGRRQADLSRSVRSRGVPQAGRRLCRAKRSPQSGVARISEDSCRPSLAGSSRERH